MANGCVNAFVKTGVAGKYRNAKQGGKMARIAGQRFQTTGKVVVEFAFIGSAHDAESAKAKVRTALAKEPVNFLDKTFVGVISTTINEPTALPNGNG